LVVIVNFGNHPPTIMVVPFQSLGVKSPDFSIANRIADRTGFKLLIVQVQLVTICLTRLFASDSSKMEKLRFQRPFFIFNIKPEDTGEEAGRCQSINL